jgi:hypothetical protein
MTCRRAAIRSVDRMYPAQIWQSHCLRRYLQLRHHPLQRPSRCRRVRTPFPRAAHSLARRALARHPSEAPHAETFFV